MKDVTQNQLNIVFMGHFSYPEGHAGTKRVQNTIDALKQTGRVQASLLILRQGRHRPGNYPLCGVYRDIPYTTIGRGIVPGISVLWKSVRYYHEGRKYLKQSFRPQMKNIVYVYGPPGLDNYFFVKRARRLGYKVVFDIVEDVFFQSSADDIFAKLKHLSERYYMNRIDRLADGILVISTHLMKGIKERVKNHNKIMLYPINLSIPEEQSMSVFSNPVTRIFYGGTYGEKDGVENLIEAFDRVWQKNSRVELILTGRGSPERMEIIKHRIQNSPSAGKIKLTGYLKDSEYRLIMQDSDILCVPRTGSEFARAGFPFKLGEYLATGKPVVVTDVGDVKRYLVDKESAVVVAPDSVVALSEALDYLMTHRKEAILMGIKGKAVAKENFDMYLLAKKLYAFFEVVLDQ